MLEANYLNLAEMQISRCKEFSNRQLYGKRSKEGDWNWITFGKFADLVNTYRATLKELGVTKETPVGIMSQNSTEFAALSYACFGLGAPIVPMYESYAPEEMLKLLNSAQIPFLFSATRKTANTVENHRESLPNLRKLIVISDPANEDDSLSSLVKNLGSNRTEIAKVEGSDTAAIIFTSGTASDPKAVVLTHNNLLGQVAGLEDFAFGDGDRTLSILPWAHIFGQVCELHLPIYRGIACAFNESLPTIKRDIDEVKPTVIIAVPKILQRLKDSIESQIDKSPSIIQSIFKNAIRCANKRRLQESSTIRETLSYSAAKYLIFPKVYRNLGGRLRFFVSGGAALDAQVGAFFFALGIPVYEGYGLTETSPVVSFNSPRKCKLKTAGQPIAGVKIVIDTSAVDSDDQREGEIVVYGHNVMREYLNNPTATTAIKTDDGGIRTGDVGYLDTEGMLCITGRIKDKYKLENGKYVDPSEYERDAQRELAIDNCMLYGENRPANILIMTLTDESVRRLLNRPASSAEDSNTPEGARSNLDELRSTVLDRLGEMNKKFQTYERPVDVLITLDPWTAENGMLTPKMSLKRRAVISRYSEQIDEIYKKRSKKSSNSRKDS